MIYICRSSSSCEFEFDEEIYHRYINDAIEKEEKEEE